MPTRWTFNESRQHNASYAFFGRTFGTCDRPSNHTCVLSDEYCRDNGTDDGNATRPDCCRESNVSSLTWYYLHLRGVRSASLITLEFESTVESSDDTVPPCDNVPLVIQPFGTVPFGSRNKMLQLVRSKMRAVHIDTLEISGMKWQFDL